MMPALLILKRFWFAIPIIGLVIALMATRGTLADAEDDLAASRQALATEKAQHAVTRASADSLMKALSDQNQAILKLKADADQRTKASQDALREARDANRAQAGQIDRLRASGTQKRPGPVCEVSNALKSVEGL